MGEVLGNERVNAVDRDMCLRIHLALCVRGLFTLTVYSDASIT